VGMDHGGEPGLILGSMFMVRCGEKRVRK
jgi:hypothetical protein